MVTTYKYLSKHYEFENLRKHYSEKQLLEFERIIAELKDPKELEKHGQEYASSTEVALILWYELIIGAEDLFHDIKAY